MKSISREGERADRGTEDPTKTQVYTSIFRHKHDDTPRNRALGVLSNVFCICIRQDQSRCGALQLHLGMGGITFFLFIILTYTGVLLMFYYHPSKCRRFAMCFISNTTCLSEKSCATCTLGGPLDGDCVWLHMFRVFLTGSYKKPANLIGISGALTGVHVIALVHRLSVARRSAWILGGNCRHEHGAARRCLDMKVHSIDAGHDAL